MKTKEWKRNSVLVVLLLVTLLVVFNSTASASNRMSKPVKVSNADNDLGTMVRKTANHTEYVTTDKQKIAEIIKRDNVVVPEGKTVISITTVMPNIDSDEEIENTVEISPKIKSPNTKGIVWLGFLVQNVVNQGNDCYYSDDIFHTTLGGPGGTIVQTIKDEISASMSCTVGVSAEVVSAKVGFNVTSTFSISDAYSKILAPTETGAIKSWVLYNLKTYEVWNNWLIGQDTYETDGFALKPSGIMFRYYQYS